MTKNKIKLAREYIKANIWKQFLKQKLYELGIIPLSILAIWKVPSWIGWGIIKAFNIDPTKFILTCETDNYFESLKCSGAEYSQGGIWVLGLLTILIISLFIAINWYKATSIVQDKASEKYGVSNFNIDYGKE